MPVRKGRSPNKKLARKCTIMVGWNRLRYSEEVKVMGFFDKLKEQASSLGAQLDQALDVTKQKSQINALRKQREEMVKQLGEALLNQFRQNQSDPEALRVQAEPIFDLERQIIELEKQIEDQKQAAARPSPASTATPPPAPFAAPATSDNAATAAGCPNCGTEVPPGSAFCPNCGNRIED